MPKLPRWTAPEAEKALLAVGFRLLERRGAIGFTRKADGVSSSLFTAEQFYITRGG